MILHDPLISSNLTEIFRKLSGLYQEEFLCILGSGAATKLSGILRSLNPSARGMTSYIRTLADRFLAVVHRVICSRVMAAKV